jgi:thiol-disulfide isomerase/thioredoxin
MWLILLIGILLGIYLAGTLNGWWLGISLPLDEQPGSIAAKGQPSVTVISTVGPVTSPAKSLTQPVVESAPDFDLPGLFDESVTYTLSQYNGRPVILNFWASWCPPCRTEMPAFQRAYENYGAEGLVVLAINQTYSDDIDAAREFANEMDLTFPLIRDDNGKVSLEEFEVRGLPTTIIIRPDRTVAIVQVGQMSDDQIEEISSRLVTGEMVP